MRLRKEVFVILYVFIFLVNDPQLVRACNLKQSAQAQTGISKPDRTINLFMGLDSSEYHLVYELNGGINNNYNPSQILKSELPVALEEPVRNGYNFAGWYTDCSFHHKITEINEQNAASMVLFAKWTKKINNNYNVEMYSYQSGKIVGKDHKELKECAYSFLDNISIPGTPYTREQDSRKNIISSSNQCLQGLCFTPELMLITSYSEDKENTGSLMVFNRESGKYLATLGMKKDSHLGGIAFDGENVWICHSSSNSLERISYDYILKIAKDEPGYCIDASALTDEYHVKNIPSCITYYGGRIWVATHRRVFNSQMYSYIYDKKNDTLTPISSYRIPSKVQGIDFDDNGSVYVSTSFGRNNSSYLKVYASLLSLNGRPDHPSAKVEMPPCSEELAILDDNVYVLFESASAKYFEGTDGYGKSISPIDKILEVNVATIW